MMDSIVSKAGSSGHGADPHVSPISRSDDYQSTLSLRHLDSLPGHVEVLVSSVWLRSKRPDQRQTRFQAVMTMEDLKGLEQTITRFLSAPPSSQHNNKEEKTTT